VPDPAHFGYLFLCGADMHPTTIRMTHPQATFVARAKLTTPQGDVWGILMQSPYGGNDLRRPEVTVTTDDGRTFTGHGDATPFGDPDDILMAARYWELPPAYIKTLPGGDR